MWYRRTREWYGNGRRECYLSPDRCYVARCLRERRESRESRKQEMLYHRIRSVRVLVRSVTGL
jgi:hypothetical protein